MMLPENTILGELEIVEVYDYLDGPKLFTAIDATSARYLVYWCDQTSSATGWLYLPISETKLTRLLQRELSLNEAFRRPERGYYLVFTQHGQGNDTAEPFLLTNVNKRYFPPEGHFIDHVDVLDTRNDWLFETIVRGVEATAALVSQFIGRFRELSESIMRGQADRQLNLNVQSTLAGSLIVKFTADDDEAALASLQVINDLVQIDNSENFWARLRELHVDPAQLRGFLTTITTKKLEVEIIPKLASLGSTITFSSEQVARCIQFLKEDRLIVLDSIKIPQADDIGKVVNVVRLVYDGTPLTPENIGNLTTGRQVAYYRDAAYAYGLITRDLQVTTAGKFLISHTTPESQNEILANMFDSTEFGWAWLRWARVNYMTELDPATAAQFLIESVPTLSEITANRRASTLRNWLNALKPFHRRYQR